MSVAIKGSKSFGDYSKYFSVGNIEVAKCKFDSKSGTSSNISTNCIPER